MRSAGGKKKTEKNGINIMVQIDIGDTCVDCGNSTAWGSGRFVNRIPADAEWETKDKEGKIVFEEGYHRVGYLCEECYCANY